MQQTQNDDKQSEARQSAEERRDPQRKHIAHTKRRAAMRRCGDAGGDAAAMLPQCGGPSRESGRSAAKRGEARRSAAKRGQARRSAAKRGQARPSAAKRGQNTASGAAAHTGHNTHTVGERGQLRHTVGAAAAPKQQPVSCWNRGAATLFVPKMGANGKKISIKMQRRLHFLEPKVKRKKTRLFEKFRT